MIRSEDKDKHKTCKLLLEDKDLRLEDKDFRSEDKNKHKTCKLVLEDKDLRLEDKDKHKTCKLVLEDKDFPRGQQHSNSANPMHYPDWLTNVSKAKQISPNIDIMYINRQETLNTN